MYYSWNFTFEKIYERFKIISLIMGGILKRRS